VQAVASAAPLSFSTKSVARGELTDAEAADRRADLKLEASQHTWIRRHALGDKSALARLQEIDDEVAVLTGEL
jgi:hypothetical protein